MEPSDAFTLASTIIIVAGVLSLLAMSLLTYFKEDRSARLSPIDFLFRHQFAWVGGIWWWLREKRKENIIRRLPFKLSCKYKLKGQEFDTDWSRGEWRQDILIYGKSGLKYDGQFKLSVRADAIFSYSDFVLLRWGDGYSDRDIPVGSNLLEIDKEIKGIIEEIGTKLRIEARIGDDFKKHWERLLEPLDNFEIARREHESNKKRKSNIAK